MTDAWLLDTECYRDYFLWMMRDASTGQVVYFERYPGSGMDIQSMGDLLQTCTSVTFNGIHYDFPIISLALAGADNATLKAASDAIILGGLKHWQVRDQFGGVDLDACDHIDLIEVAPGLGSLKIYGGRLHSKRLQDLPIEPSASISPSDRELLKEYCHNDLLTTGDLLASLQPQIDLRIEMSKEFGLDLRSKSDAQIAEAVIKSEVQKLLGAKVYRPDIDPRYRFKYDVPEYVQFQSYGMKHVLEIIRNAEFHLKPDGSVALPELLEFMRLRIGAGVYSMGIGGLHSSESSVSHIATDGVRILDTDATSYYPSIVLTRGLYPAHLGEPFLRVYRGLVERRVAAKHAGNKVMSEALKIVVNGSFGKLGSPWSVLYSPDLMIAVTLTGQLALLMLIETLELNGLTVLSANTDGVVARVPDAQRDLFDALVSAWEISTGFTTEETEYSALYAKDVNNYIAIKPDGEVKTKGLYATVGLQKNPTNTLCVRAAMAYLQDRTPVADTVRGVVDCREVITIRQVKGGAKYGDEYLGKAVRWYYAAGETRHIEYASNGNKVAKSDGARPLMSLPLMIPRDLDYDWYINEALSILQEVGV